MELEVKKRILKSCNLFINSKLLFKKKKLCRQCDINSYDLMETT